MTETTMRQEFLQAASDINEAFGQARLAESPAARNTVRAAYARLAELGTQIPDVPAGSPLRYGGMEDKGQRLRHSDASCRRGRHRHAPRG